MLLRAPPRRSLRRAGRRSTGLGSRRAARRATRPRGRAAPACGAGSRRRARRRGEGCARQVRASWIDSNAVAGAGGTTGAGPGCDHRRMADDHAAAVSTDAMPEELHPRHLRRRLLELVLLGVVVAAVVGALPGLGEVRRRFDHAHPGFIALAGVFELASCLSYVVAFRDVFCPSLPWGFSYNLAMAEQATNVLVPTGGAGGLALGAWALRQGGMATEYIGRRSVAFFILTSIPNFACAALGGTLLALHVLPGHAPLVPTIVL